MKSSEREEAPRRGGAFRCGNVRFGEAGKAAGDRLSFRLTAPYSEERRRSRSRSDGIHRQKNERKSYILTFVNEKLQMRPCIAGQVVVKCYYI